MKILIYGFKPYKKWKHNITEKIIKRIRKRKNLVKIVLDVKFEKKLFLDAIKKTKPDVIFGLGQHPRGEKIRIERKATNLWKHTKKEKPKIISKNKPKYQLVNLKLRKDNNSWISYGAGMYVCNFSMFVLSDYCNKRGVRFAFIHFPHNYNLNKAVRFVEKKINKFIKP